MAGGLMKNKSRGLLNIKPRKKLENESNYYTVLRRLEEYIEFEENTGRMADAGFHATIMDFIIAREQIIDGLCNLIEDAVFMPKNNKTERSKDED